MKPPSEATEKENNSKDNNLQEWKNKTIRQVEGLRDLLRDKAHLVDKYIEILKDI